MTALVNGVTIGKDPKYRNSSRCSQSDDVATSKARAWIEGVIGEKLEGEFGAALKSGQALCRLINVIRPKSIIKVEKSATPFKQMANISSFLSACRKLGVPEYALFETLDLFNEKQIPQVVRCLYALSTIIRLKVPEFQGPYLEIHQPIRQSFDPAAKAAVNLSKGTAAPAWEKVPVAALVTRTPDPASPHVRRPVTPGRKGCMERRTVSLAIDPVMMEKEDCVPEETTPLQPLISPSNAAGTLTYGVYEGVGKKETPKTEPRSRGDRAGGLEGQERFTQRSSSLSKHNREKERSLRREAIAQADAAILAAWWIEGVTGETFPGKLWSSLRDGGLTRANSMCKGCAGL
ncbi:unnamed protein product [Choristocarpus tenellus]